MCFFPDNMKPPNPKKRSEVKSQVSADSKADSQVSQQVYFAILVVFIEYLLTTHMLHGLDSIHTLQLNFLFSDWLLSKNTECIENVYCTLRTVPRCFCVIQRERHIDWFIFFSG